MHKIFETKGGFNLEYQIPKIIYSSLISMFFDKIFSFLALSDDNIIDLKQKKTQKDADIRKNNLEKRLRIKFIFYFILGFLFLLCFWYYIALFGVIYKNTQMHLLNDTLISFGLSLIYPFGIYLLPGIFRIPALMNPKNNRECLYNFSKLLQKF